jgi:hypothetical protein
MTTLRRCAWWYLVIFSVLIALFGLDDLRGGITGDPAITAGLSDLTLPELEAQSAAGYRLYDFTARTQGTALIVIGILLATILLIPYRSGIRWAWYVMWTLPTWSFTVLVLYVLFGVDPSQPPPAPMVSGPVLGGIAVLVLILDRRRFFGSG